MSFVFRLGKILHAQQGTSASSKLCVQAVTMEMELVSNHNRIYNILSTICNKHGCVYACGHIFIKYHQVYPCRNARVPEEASLLLSQTRNRSAGCTGCIQLPCYMTFSHLLQPHVTMKSSSVLVQSNEVIIAKFPFTRLPGLALLDRSALGLCELK